MRNSRDGKKHLHFTMAIISIRVFCTIRTNPKGERTTTFVSSCQVFAPFLKNPYVYVVTRGVGTEKFSGGHLNFGGAQRGYFRNFGRFYGFFIAISEIIGGKGVVTGGAGGARAPPIISEIPIKNP